MSLEAFVLGTGGMMPLPYRHLTSVMVRREGELFLFDCGEATQIALKKLNLKWKKISAIFISHTHADHITGLPGILMLSSQVDRTEPLMIFGPPKVKEFYVSMKKSLDMFINYPIVVPRNSGSESTSNPGGPTRLSDKILSSESQQGLCGLYSG
jgi:ribonuclease Z